MKRSLLVTALACFVGCGSAPKTTPPASSPSVVPVVPPAPPAMRGPSADLQQLWPFVDGPQLVLYVDVAGLRNTTVIGTIARGLGAAFGVTESPWWKCGWAAWSTARELAVGGDPTGDILLVRFDGAPPLDECAPVIGGGPTSVGGASQAFQTDKNDVIALRGPIVVSGDRSLVTSAFKGASEGAGSGLSRVTLDADEYVAAYVSVRDPAVSGRASLLATDQRFRLAFDGHAPEDYVREVEAVLEQARNSDVVRGAPVLVRLLQDLTLTRTGDHVQGAFELTETPVEQARDIGIALSTGIYGIRKYIAQAKTEEARIVLHQVASRLADWASKEAEAKGPSGKRAKIKLFALSPVPSAVPRAMKYQSVPGDWKDWQKIHFELGEPQYYQYEVKASKDGQSADILARGDLNGDGKESLFTLKVVVNKETGNLEVSPKLEEIDPQE